MLQPASNCRTFGAFRLNLDHLNPGWQFKLFYCRKHGQI